MRIEPRKDLAKDIAKGIRKVTDQTGKHKSINKMAKLTDLKGDHLTLAVMKLSDVEKKRMLHAFAELDRVVHVITKVEEH